MFIVDIVIGPCIDGSIHIIPSNARSAIKGRVEVCFNGIWGTICSLNWDDQDASVACKQLGYSAEGLTQILKCICNAFFFLLRTLYFNNRGIINWELPRPC